MQSLNLQCTRITSNVIVLGGASLLSGHVLFTYTQTYRQAVNFHVVKTVETGNEYGKNNGAVCRGEWRWRPRQVREMNGPACTSAATLKPKRLLYSDCVVWIPFMDRFSEI